MTFDNTIKELNKVRNLEHERLRYDRTTWIDDYGMMLGDIRMVEASKKMVRKPEEALQLEEEIRMSEYYGYGFDRTKYLATKEEVQKLGEIYKEEYKTHEETVNKTLEEYQKKKEAIKKDLIKVLNKHDKKIKESLKELADLQQDEKHILLSKSGNRLYEGSGIREYEKHFDSPVNTNPLLAKNNVPDYSSLYRDETKRATGIINELKGEL